jgi:hypothetical protein
VAVLDPPRSGGGKKVLLEKEKCLRGVIFNIVIDICPKHGII